VEAEAVAARGHQLCTDGKTAFDAAHADLIGDILHCLQARRAKTIDGARGRSVGETGGERGSADVVGGFRFGDL